MGDAGKPSVGGSKTRYLRDGINDDENLVEIVMLKIDKLSLLSKIGKCLSKIIELELIL